jgi:hypothetical protein
MTALDTFERKELFAFARLFAISLIALLLVGIGLSVIFVSTTFIPPRNIVSFNDVMEIINSKKAATATDTHKIPEKEYRDPNMLPGVKIPFVLQPYVSNESNRNVLFNKLEKMAPELRQSYLENMANIAVDAEKNNVDVPDAINTYMELRAKLQAQEEIKKLAVRETRKYVIGAFLTGLALVALFSLVLVLLAIERNTRRS